MMSKPTIQDELLNAWIDHCNWVTFDFLSMRVMGENDGMVPAFGILVPECANLPKWYKFMDVEEIREFYGHRTQFHKYIWPPHPRQNIGSKYELAGDAGLMVIFKYERELRWYEYGDLQTAIQVLHSETPNHG